MDTFSVLYIFDLFNIKLVILCWHIFVCEYYSGKDTQKEHEQPVIKSAALINNNRNMIHDINSLYSVQS